MSSNEYGFSSGKYRLAYLPGGVDKKDSIVGKTVDGKPLERSLVGVILSSDEFAWFVHESNKRKVG